MDNTPYENPAQTMHTVMKDIGDYGDIKPPLHTVDDVPHLITIPKGREVVDLTRHYRDAKGFRKPLQRKGTARLTNLASLIAWSNRFKSEDSALFANPDMTTPSLTCIADYHSAGAADPTNPDGDPTARHCHHRAVYDFPLSKEWTDWMSISGQPLDKDEMGEFIEAHAKDIMDPTPAVLDLSEDNASAEWEKRLIRTASQINGRFGQLTELLSLSRTFAVHETSDLTVTTNRDTGEASIQFQNEHRQPDGKPVSIPNLIIIAIPVFLGGAPYRMAVRFRYVKRGAQVKFTLSLYTPEKVFEASFEEAILQAAEETGLPIFMGRPES